MDRDSEVYPGWCPEVIEVHDLDRATDVAHMCKHEYDHDGQHCCQGCGLKWEMEVPC